MADNPNLFSGPNDDYDSQWTGPEIDSAVGRALPGGAIDEALTPKWLATGIYPPGTSVIHAGILWTNVSNTDSTNVEPGTNMEVWYPQLVDGSVSMAKLAPDVVAAIGQGGGGAAVGRNLFANWYFRTPLNPLNQTSYTAAGYTIAMWILSNPGQGIILGDDGITVLSAGAELSQRMEGIAAYAGRPCTLSMLLADGTLHTGTVAVINWELDTPQTAFDDDVMSCTITQIDTDVCEVTYTMKIAELVLEAAEMALGTQQTLARETGGSYSLNAVPPDKDLELLKCQQYFIPAANNWLTVPYVNGGGLLAMIPGHMRAKPVALDQSNQVFGITDGQWHDITLSSIFYFPTYIILHYVGYAPQAGMSFLLRRQPALSAQL